MDGYDWFVRMHRIEGQLIIISTYLINEMGFDKNKMFKELSIIASGRPSSSLLVRFIEALGDRDRSALLTNDTFFEKWHNWDGIILEGEKW